MECFGGHRGTICGGLRLPIAKVDRLDAEAMRPVDIRPGQGALGVPLCVGTFDFKGATGFEH